MAEFIDFLSPAALKDLEKANAELVKMVANVDKVGQEMKNISTPSGSDSAVKNLTDQYKQQEKVILSLQNQIQKLTEKQNNNTASKKKEVQAILDQAKSYQSLEKQRQKEISLLEKEQAKLAASENVYNKIQAKLNSLSFEYRNLAAKRELGVTLTAKEEATYNRLQSRIQKYDTALKAVDATMGKHQRNVGNYSSAFNPLSNSINQLTREAPAFANSIQTGFMAISNNLPIFFDAMQNVIAQNKELQAQGKPTQSVLSQLANSLFSFQTLLGAGVTLLTVYGKEIVNWVSSLMGASDALDEINQRQKDFNNARIQGRKDAQSEIIELQKYISVAKNRALSDEERNIALKALRSQYPFYFKELTDQQILTGNIEKAEKALMQALEKRKEVEKKTTLSVENRQRRIDIEKELEALNKSIPVLQKTFALRKEQAAGDAQFSGALSNAQNKLNKALKDQTALQKELNEINKNEIQNQNEIVRLKAETIGLEYQEDKAKKARKKDRIDLNFREIESEYNLKLAILERQKAERSDRMNNEQLSLDDRFQARKEFSEKSIEILQLQIDKEKALIAFTAKEDLLKNNNALRNKEISYEQFLENVKDINKRFNNEMQKVDIDASLAFNDLMNQDADFYRKLQNEKRKFTEETNNAILKSEQKKYEKISLDEKNALRIRQQAHDRYLHFAKLELDAAKLRELANSESEEETTAIITKYKELYRALDGLKTPTQKAREEFEKYLETISSGAVQKSLDEIGMSSLKMFVDLDRNGQSTFDKLIESAKTTGEVIAVTFQGLGDVIQDVYSLIDQNQQRQYENELKRLERAKNIAIAFAGESATARAAIDEQYEARKLQLERQRIKQQKQMAIFNAVINTAQAVVAALNTAPPASFIFAALAGAIGAAQIAMIASQPLPQFYKGTDNAPEGWAWTQEKGAEIITDKKGRVKTMGNSKGAQLTYLEKGDKVYTASESAIMFDNNLNQILTDNNISPSIIVNSENSGIREEIQELGKIIKNRESITIIKDVKGERIYQKQQGNRNQILNNRLRIKGYDI